MSRTETLRRVTRGDIIAHGESVIAALEAEEGFAEVKAQAEALGVHISVYVRDTFTYDKQHDFKLAEDDEDIPYGYAADLRIDMTREGRILFAQDEFGGFDQLTQSYNIIYTPDTLFGKKLTFREYAEIDGSESIIDYLAGFLDTIKEDKGGIASVLVANDEADAPLSEQLDMIEALSDLPEGEDVVEICGGAFSGIYLAEGSLFFTRDGFRPMGLLLEARQFGFFCDHGVSTIDREKWDTFKKDLAGFTKLAEKGVPGFTEICSQLGLYSLEPSAKEEKRLNQITSLRAKEFADTCKRFIAWGDQKMEEQGDGAVLSILWP